MEFINLIILYPLKNLIVISNFLFKLCHFFAIFFGIPKFC